MTDTVTNLPGQNADQGADYSLPVCEDTPVEETEMEADVEHLDNLLVGYDSILSHETLDAGSVTGVEQYTLTTLRLRGVDGMEALDGLKAAAAAVYEMIMATLKKIKDFFTGEGKKSADDAEKRADESLEALAKLDGNAPIPEGSGVLDEDKYMGKVKENDKLNQMLTEHPKIKSVYEKLTGSISRIKNSKTVANIGAAYQAVIADAKSALDAVQGELTTAVNEAEKAAKLVQNPKEVKPEDPAEIKQSVKEEQKQNTAEAKAKTAAAQLLGSAQTKLTSLLNTISNGIGSIGTSKPKSEFKG